MTNGEVDIESVPILRFMAAQAKQALLRDHGVSEFVAISDVSAVALRAVECADSIRGRAVCILLIAAAMVAELPGTEGDTD